MNSPSVPIQTASSSLQMGTRLAEFEITGVIGEGGFGIVYSAHDSSLDRTVAIKEYFPSAFAQRGADHDVMAKSEEHRKTFVAGLTSFINEAKMLAKFSHPGLVEVFRFWEANGTAYMAMRYYRGVTLREAMRSPGQRMTEQLLCEILDPILLALKELHNERCFHRDIAPDNILVLPNGKSVLMDFGAARRIISGMTQALTTVLKPGYAPIEQYYDDGSMPQGAWTDIYAIGGVLYHAMTGKVPVQAISRMMTDPLKPVADVAVGEFSERMAGAVMKCMAVLPENRYQNIDELRAALGWVTTPVVSTVVHKPLNVPSSQSDPQATVMVSSQSPEHQAALDYAATTRVEPMPSVQAAAFAVPHATATVLPVSVPVPPAEESINDFLTENPVLAKPAPTQPSVFNPAASARAAKAKPAAVVAQALPTEPVKSKSSPGLWAGVVVLVLVLAGVGFFLWGSPEEPVTAAAPAQQPTEAATPFPPLTEQTAAAVPVEPVAAASEPQALASDPVAVAGVEVPAPAVSAPSAVVPAALPQVASAAPTPVPVAPTTGLVRVELKGGWGTVFVNGQEKGTVPPVLRMRLPEGSYEIEIQNPAVPTVRKTVNVVAGKTAVVRHAYAKY